jgi:hypothetical protein
MAVSEKQRLANIRNAQKSTGPKTQEGKQASRANALKHGLSGEGVVLPQKMAQAVEQRLASWLPLLKPEDEMQLWYAKRYCIESVRIDYCFQEEPILLNELTQKARESWELNRTLEARQLMRRLHNRPEIVQGQLLQTKQGCEEILLRWEHLAKQLERNNGVWGEADWKMALNLLGVAKDRRDDSLPGPRYNLEWIVEQMTELERLQAEVLEARDDRERIAAQAGCPLSVHADIKNQRRYESTCHFRMRWAKTQLDLSKAMPVEVEVEVEHPAEIIPEANPEPQAPAPVSEPPASPAATEVKAPAPSAKPFQRQPSQAAERRKKKQQRKAESKARRQQQKRARRR